MLFFCRHTLKSHLTQYLFRIPVVDIRGDISEDDDEESEEDFLSFDTEDDTSDVDYSIYDFYPYDTNSDDNNIKVASRKRRR